MPVGGVGSDIFREAVGNILRDFHDRAVRIDPWPHGKAPLICGLAEETVCYVQGGPSFLGKHGGACGHGGALAEESHGKSVSGLVPLPRSRRTSSSRDIGGCWPPVNGRTSKPSWLR